MARTCIRANGDYFEDDSPIISDVPFTISIWIKLAIIDQFQWVAAFAGTAANRYHSISIDSDNTATMNSRGANGAMVIKTVATVSTGVWFHQCGVWADDNDRRLYLNGANKVTDNRMPGAGTMSHFDLGIAQSGGTGSHSASTLDGDFAELAIYDVALTDDEVAAIANRTNPNRIRRPNLVHYYPLYGNASPEADYARGSQMTIFGTPAGANHAPVSPPFGYDPGWQGIPGGAVVTGGLRVGDTVITDIRSGDNTPSAQHVGDTQVWP